MVKQVEEVKTLEEAWARLHNSRDQIKKEAEIMAHKYLAEQRFQQFLLQQDSRLERK